MQPVCPHPHPDRRVPALAPAPSRRRQRSLLGLWRSLLGLAQAVEPRPVGVGAQQAAEGVSQQVRTLRGDGHWTTARTLGWQFLSR